MLLLTRLSLTKRTVILLKLSVGGQILSFLNPLLLTWLHPGLRLLVLSKMRNLLSPLLLLLFQLCHHHQGTIIVKLRSCMQWVGTSTIVQYSSKLCGPNHLESKAAGFQAAKSCIHFYFFSSSGPPYYMKSTRMILFFKLLCLSGLDLDIINICLF